MRRFGPEDMEQVEGWYRARGLAQPPPSTLSACGFIEPGVAAGWLYRTDADFALAEGIVTNPAATPGERHAALNALMGALVEQARKCGFRVVLGVCRDPGIASRAMDSHGCRSLGMAALVAREV